MTPEEKAADQENQRRHATQIRERREDRKLTDEQRDRKNILGQMEGMIKRAIEQLKGQLKITGTNVAGNANAGWTINAPDPNEDGPNTLPSGINGDTLYHNGTRWVVLNAPTAQGLYVKTVAVSSEGVPTVAWTATTESCPPA